MLPEALDKTQLAFEFSHVLYQQFYTIVKHVPFGILRKQVFMKEDTY